MVFTLRGARIVDATMDVPSGDLTVEGGRILAVGQSTNHKAAGDGVGEESEPDGGNGVSSSDPQRGHGNPNAVRKDLSSESIDASDAVIMPGFIDVHTHGGGGFNLHTTDPEEIWNYGRWVSSTGVTGYLIATVGTPGYWPKAQLAASVAALEGWRKDDTIGGAEPVGLFLEGPYISVKRRGAHPPEWLRTPDPAETKQILALTKGYLRLLTIAPELSNAHDMIRTLVDAGVTVSMGHTDITYEQALEAIDMGVTHVTHSFNAMRPLHHRDPGLMSAVAERKHVFGELIADGIHVHPAMMHVLVRLLGTQRVVVITDAQAGAGLPDVEFEFGGQKARVICGAARLSDGTLAGSALTLDHGLHNVISMTNVTLQDAVAMMTFNPAKAINVADHKGLLHRGYDADFVIFDAKTLTLQATFVRGQLAYASDAWKSRLNVAG